MGERAAKGGGRGGVSVALMMGSIKVRYSSSQTARNDMVKKKQWGGGWKASYISFLWLVA